MSFDAALTLVVLAVTIGLLVTDRLSPPVVMLSGVVTLLVSGVIDEQQAFSGFGNSAPITVAALYVLAGAAESTGALEGLTRRALGPADQASKPTLAIARLGAPVTAMSALLPNTPLVSMLAPRVVAWARRGDRSPSPFLMPLSYAAILGGIITVLGTSTNLVVSGLLDAQGDEPLRVFEITPIGLPVAIVGLIVLIFTAPHLLPERQSPSDQVRRRARMFTVEMQVADGSPLVGQTVDAAGLRQLAGVFLVGIERRGRAIAPVGPDDVLEGGDYLAFIGDVSDVVDLHRIPGLVSAADDHLSVIANAPGGRLFEVVVAEGSALQGSTLKDVGFRARYGGAVFAIHRADEQLTGKLGQVELRAGDVLVVLAESGFRDRWTGDPDFLIVSALAEEPPPRRDKARLVEIVLLAVVAAAAFNVLSLTKASLVGAVAVLGLRVISAADARRAVNLNVLLVIAASFGLGAAVQTTGLAADAANLLVANLETFGTIGVVAGIYLATAIATELLTNNAAAVLLFPVAMAISDQTGLNPRLLAITVLVAASCSFLTPIGYQTNTMVFGLGGYRFSDFTRVGIPLTLACFTATTALVTLAA
ncbi:MAG: SLC13 family permease [Acidimicrobiales bacterium]